jgi:hypothetical protein
MAGGVVRQAGAVVLGVLAAGIPAAAPAATAATSEVVAAAASSYWTIHNRPVAGPAYCLTSAPQDDGATSEPCDGGAGQDWAFTNGSGGEYLVSRQRPGYVLAVSSLAPGASATLKRRDAADVTQVFVAGDPVARDRNHVRPRASSGLCLEMRPPRSNRSAVVLVGCATSAVGGQVWLSTFSGNH